MYLCGMAALLAGWGAAAAVMALAARRPRGYEAVGCGDAGAAAGSPGGALLAGEP